MSDKAPDKQIEDSKPLISETTTRPNQKIKIVVQSSQSSEKFPDSLQ